MPRRILIRYSDDRVQHSRVKDFWRYEKIGTKGRKHVYARTAGKTKPISPRKIRRLRSEGGEHIQKAESMLRRGMRNAPVKASIPSSGRVKGVKYDTIIGVTFNLYNYYEGRLDISYRTFKFRGKVQPKNIGRHGNKALKALRKSFKSKGVSQLEILNIDEITYYYSIREN